MANPLVLRTRLMHSTAVHVQGHSYFSHEVKTGGNERKAWYWMHSSQVLHLFAAHEAF